MSNRTSLDPDMFPAEEEEPYSHIKEDGKFACSGDPAYPHIWAFVNLEHAEAAVRKGTLAQPCPLCVSKLSDLPITIVTQASFESEDGFRSYLDRRGITCESIAREGDEWLASNCKLTSESIIPSGAEFRYG